MKLDGNTKQHKRLQSRQLFLFDSILVKEINAATGKFITADEWLYMVVKNVWSKKKNFHSSCSTFSAEQQLFAGLQSKLQCICGMLALSFVSSKVPWWTFSQICLFFIVLMHVNQVILISVCSCGVFLGTGAFTLKTDMSYLELDIYTRSCCWSN